MRTDTTAADITELLRSLSSADIFARPSSVVLSGAHRLEAGFYGSEGYRAVRAMENSGFEIGRVGDLSHVRWFGPFSRVYVEDHGEGVPFLSSADIMAAKLEPKNYISKTLTPMLGRLLVRRGTILISCSGTIGNVALCTSDYDGMAVSQHAIRVDTRKDIDRGMLYVFLLSNLGQFLVTRNKSGSVIESIYAKDVEDLPIPILPLALRRTLTDRIQEACDLRVRANARLEDADNAVGVDCNVPAVESNSARNTLDVGSGKAYIVSSAERLQHDGTFGCQRLDATFHDPRCVSLRARIATLPGSMTVQQATLGIYRSSLRARDFVPDQELGVPMIGGKQMTHSRPAGIKYLSRLLTRNLAAERILPETTLITCGGTIGRVLYCQRNYEDWVASEHIMKLVPNRDVIWPGFLYAFLASSFGQVQVEALMHGSVISQVRDFEFGGVVIAVPPDKGRRIHEMVVEAYDQRATAKSLEEEALNLFLNAIKVGRLATEDQWGREY